MLARYADSPVQKPPQGLGRKPPLLKPLSLPLPLPVHTLEGGILPFLSLSFSCRECYQCWNWAPAQILLVPELTLSRARDSWVLASCHRALGPVLRKCILVGLTGRGL